MSIRNEDLTFVMQGPVVQDTLKSVQSILDEFPGADIVLSTWSGSDVEKIKQLGVRNIVFSTDPGDSGKMFLINNIPNNINRQIISTKAGVAQVKTKYAIKTRTDFFFTNANFISYLEKFNDYCINEEMRFVDQRILCLGADRRFPFFVFDFCFAGRTIDLKRLFNIELMQPSESQYFPTNNPENIAVYNLFHSRFRWIPEQFIVLNSLKQNNISSISDYMEKDWTGFNEEIMLKSLRSLVSNFCILGFENFGVIPMKASLQWLLNNKNKDHISFEEWVFHYSNLTGVKISDC